MEEHFSRAENDPYEIQSLLRNSEYDGEHGCHVHLAAEVTYETEWYGSKKAWKQLSAMNRVIRMREQNGSTSIEYT